MVLAASNETSTWPLPATAMRPVGALGPGTHTVLPLPNTKPDAQAPHVEFEAVVHVRPLAQLEMAVQLAS